jgi:hypothetical protein
MRSIHVEIIYIIQMRNIHVEIASSLLDTYLIPILLTNFERIRIHTTQEYHEYEYGCHVFSCKEVFTFNP